MSKNEYNEVEDIMGSFDTHLGRLNLIRLQKNADKINQINVITGESETHGSVRLRSIRLAQALTSRGIGLEKVLMLCATNHCDITIPVVSSLYIGTAVMSLSVDMTHMEIRHHILIGKPDIIFCDADVAIKFRKVLNELNISPEVVVFGEKPHGNFTAFEDLTRPTGTEDQFQATDFDPKTVPAFIILSSGTTGISKGVCLTHQNFAVTMLLPDIFKGYSINLFESVLFFSPYIWMSALVINQFSSLLGTTRLQSHLPFTPEIAVEAINKYKPYSVFLSPPLISSLLKYPKLKECDFSSIRTVTVGGSIISSETIEKMQEYVINGKVENVYGMTEAGVVCRPFTPKKDTCGQMVPWTKWKVVDPETRQELGPHKVGELLLKSPWSIFMCYYNNPVATAAAFDGDWYRTGDLVYYDEDEDFFVVGRLKDLVKFRNYQVAPAELEDVIAQIKGVHAVCVVGLPHPDDGEHPAAFVQLLPGSNTTAEIIQNIVKESLSDPKQLRGGVAFLDQLPVTHSGKINKKALNDMKMNIFHKIH